MLIVPSNKLAIGSCQKEVTPTFRLPGGLDPPGAETTTSNSYDNRVHTGDRIPESAGCDNRDQSTFHLPSYL